MAQPPLLLRLRLRPPRDIFTIIAYGTPDELRRYLEEGDPNIRDLEDYSTPLHYAIEYDNSEMIDMLIRAGANVNENTCGLTPLHLAVFTSPRYKVIKGLLDAGADLDILDNQGNTILHSILFYFIYNNTSYDIDEDLFQSLELIIQNSCYHLQTRNNRGDIPHDIIMRMENERIATIILRMIDNYCKPTKSAKMLAIGTRRKRSKSRI